LDSPCECDVEPPGSTSHGFRVRIIEKDQGYGHITPGNPRGSGKLLN
jgi:hypothetical protein